MNQKKISECINKYAEYMEEIKKRTEVVRKIHALHKISSSLTGFIETDIDLVYLQVRKITELVMFACVVANKSAGLALNKTLRKGYEIGKIKKELQRFNTDFFPTPKKDSGLDTDGLRKIEDVSQSDITFMTEPELFKAYGRAGNFLHAQRNYQYGRETAKLKILDQGFEYIYQLVILLNHHWVNITKDSSFAVVMSTQTNSKVGVSYMKKISEQSTLNKKIQVTPTAHLI